MPLSDITAWIPTGLSATGILVFLITGFARGWLYTRSQVDKQAAQYEDRIKESREVAEARIASINAERLEWKEIAMASIDANRKSAPTLDALLDGQQTMKQLLQGFRDRTAEGGS